MRAIAAAGCLILLFPHVSTSAADPTEEQRPARPAFAICAAEEDAEIALSLMRLLQGDDKTLRFAKADTIEHAASIDAEVLVLVLPKPDPGRLEQPTPENETLEALRHRKIVGIGSGAAQLFAELGMVVRGGQTCGKTGRRA